MTLEQVSKWMRRNTPIVTLVVAIIICLATFFVVNNVPLATDDVPINKITNGKNKIKIAPGETIVQNFVVPVASLNGLEVFADSSLDKQKITFGVSRGNHVLAETGSFKKTYSDSNATIKANFFPINVKKGEKLSLNIKNESSSVLELWTTKKDDDKTPITFSLFTPRLLNSTESNGVWVALGVIIGLAGLSFIFDEKKKFVAGVFLLALTAPFAVAGFYSIDKWGISDWDYYFSVHEAYRETVLTHHQFPLWTPYTSGGTAALADPEFPFFSATFLAELVFGIPIGIRIAIVLSLIVGGTGMMFLLRSLKLKTEASFLAAVVYMFGSVNLIEIVEGHVNVFAAMWIPWVLWAWLKMIRKEQRPLITGIFLAVMFYAGGIYLLMYMTIAFIGLGLVSKKPLQNYWLTFKAGLWALGLSAVKLVPVFLWLRKFPDESYASSTNTIFWLKEIFFSRFMRGANVIYQQGSGWHEYGAYIGYFVLLLVVFSLLYFKKIRIVRILFLSAVIAILISASGPVLKPFFDVFPYMPRSNISRFVLLAVIPLAILAAYGVEFVREKIRFGSVVSFVIVSAVVLDLISFSYQLSTQSFVLPSTVLETKAVYPIEYSGDAHEVEHRSEKFSRSYANMLAGYGSTTFPSVLGPDSRVKIIQDEEHPFLEFSVKGVSGQTLKWTPNGFVIKIKADEAGTVKANANYSDGWYVNGKLAKESDGRITAEFPKGNSIFVFKYKTPGLILGLVITLFTFVLAFYFSAKKKLFFGLFAN